jgi:hypothetical protein
MKNLLRRSVQHRLFRDEAGNIAMTLALAALPMFACISAAVDYASISSDETSFRAAADTALLAVVASDKANLAGLSTADRASRMIELETLAQEYIEGNFQVRSGGDPIPMPKLTVDGASVRMEVDYKLNAPMLSAFGVFNPTIHVDAEVRKAASPVEVALVMDTTGSMGSTYMLQAKTAAHTLLDKLYGASLSGKPEDPNIRLALVPFSAAVQLDRNAYDFDMSWIDTTGAAPVSRLNFTDPSWHNYMAWSRLSNTPWNGCVEAREGDLALSDDPPAAGLSRTLFTPYFAPDEATFPNSTNSPYYFSNGGYVGVTGTPNETTGIAFTPPTTTTTTTTTSGGLTSTITSTKTNPPPGPDELLRRQKNQNKYVGRVISAETTSNYGPWFNCARSKTVPLTYNRSKIEAGIELMKADGITAIPEGLAWGWRVLSPTAPFTKVEAGPAEPASTIAPYRDAHWSKVLVLMTDGENDVVQISSGKTNDLNGTFYSAYGYGKAPTYNRFGVTTGWNAALDQKMLTLCSRIKEQGITIFTVAFRVSSPTILGNLKNCASTEAHYSFAVDGTALNSVFDHIGQNISNKSVHLVK